MKVIIFGSTGGTGLATAAAYASNGHLVTAFARDPSKLPSVTGVKPLQGDVMNAADVNNAVAGHDLVIVTLGNSQNPFAMMLGAKRTTPKNVCATGTRHIIAAMQAAGMNRLLVVSAFGVGDTRELLPFAFKLFYRLVLYEHMADKENQEEIVKASSLDWTLVQPVGLTDGPATGDWLADTTGKIRKTQISRADVAGFLLSLAEGHYSRATVSLSG